MTPYHERLTVRLREAAEECRHGQHTGVSDQRLVLLMNAAKALEDVSGNLAQARAERDALRAELAEVKSDADESSVFLSQANDDLTESRRVLRSCEWAGRDRNGHECCPVCGMVDTMGHDDACALAAVLAQEEK